MKFFIKDFFSKCDQIRGFVQYWFLINADFVHNQTQRCKMEFFWEIIHKFQP